MINKMKRICLAAACMFSAFGLMAQAPDFVTAKASEVSLYLNSAEIVQTVNVSLRKGANTIVVKNIANQVDENSIRVSADKAVTILSAAFTNKYYSDVDGNQNSALLKVVKDSIDWVNNTLSVISNKMETNRQTIDLLDDNKSLGGAQTGVSVEALGKMVSYYSQERLRLMNGTDDLKKQQVEWQKTLGRLQNQLSVSQGASEKIANGKLVLQITSEQATAARLEVSYMTYLARWQPFYEIEANGIDQPLHLVTKAKIAQTTGMDWQQVKLSLSSTLPTPSNSIPEFGRWWLRLQPIAKSRGADMRYRTQTGSVTTITAKDLEKKPMTNIVSPYGNLSPTKDNSILDDQSISSASLTQITEQTLSVNYELSIPYDIPANGKTQTVTLANQEVPATYNYYAAPKLNKDAYLVARVADYGNYNLLKGEANIIFDGRYVGKTTIDPSRTVDTLLLPLGVDKEIVVKRKQVQEKSGNKTFSGYRQSEFGYEISVRNNKKTAINLILKDQLPISTDKEITVEPGNMDVAAMNQETGTLTWELKLKPQQTKEVQFSYKVKYPKDRVVQNL